MSEGNKNMATHGLLAVVAIAAIVGVVLAILALKKADTVQTTVTEAAPSFEDAKTVSKHFSKIVAATELKSYTPVVTVPFGAAFADMTTPEIVSITGHHWANGRQMTGLKVVPSTLTKTEVKLHSDTIPSSYIQPNAWSEQNLAKVAHTNTFFPNIVQVDTGTYIGMPFSTSSVHQTVTATKMIDWIRVSKEEKGLVAYRENYINRQTGATGDTIATPITPATCMFGGAPWVAYQSAATTFQLVTGAADGSFVNYDFAVGGTAPTTYNTSYSLTGISGTTLTADAAGCTKLKLFEWESKLTVAFVDDAAAGLTFAQNTSAPTAVVTAGTVVALPMNAKHTVNATAAITSFDSCLNVDVGVTHAYFATVGEIGGTVLKVFRCDTPTTAAAAITITGAPTVVAASKVRMLNVPYGTTGLFKPAVLFVGGTTDLSCAMGKVKSDATPTTWVAATAVTAAVSMSSVTSWDACIVGSQIVVTYQTASGLFITKGTPNAAGTAITWGAATAAEQYSEYQSPGGVASDGLLSSMTVGGKVHTVFKDDAGTLSITNPPEDDKYVFTVLAGDKITT